MSWDFWHWWDPKFLSKQVARPDEIFLTLLLFREGFCCRVKTESVQYPPAIGISCSLQSYPEKLFMDTWWDLGPWHIFFFPLKYIYTWQRGGGQRTQPLKEISHHKKHIPQLLRPKCFWPCCCPAATDCQENRCGFFLYHQVPRELGLSPPITWRDTSPHSYSVRKKPQDILSPKMGRNGKTLEIVQTLTWAVEEHPGLQRLPE